jgi:hypothetical protein
MAAAMVEVIRWDGMGQNTEERNSRIEKKEEK